MRSSTIEDAMRPHSSVSRCRQLVAFKAILPIALLLTSVDPATSNDHRPVPQTGSVAFRATKQEPQVPRRFQLKDHDFKYAAKYQRKSGPVRVYKIQFPSPVKSEHAANNTVHADYFQPKGKGPFPAVVVIHILGGEFPLSQMIANGLARKGIAALFIKLPYYGERRGNTRGRYFISFEPDVTKRNFTQAVLDVRRAAGWLAARPEVDADQLGITGISLGGIMTALSAPAEPRFKKVAIYLGGGDLGNMVWSHPNQAASAFRKSWLARGETKASFLKKVTPVDPVTYGHLLKKRQVLMIAAKNDEIVPPASTKALWEAAGRKPKLVWLDAGHISAMLHLVGEMERLNRFFAAEQR